MPLWRRTLYTLWVTQFIAVAGFSFVTPFIPYYIQELGVSDVRQVGMWAGLVTSAQAISMALIAPVWGSLADRYGRKLMVLRATFGGAVILTLMGFVTNVQQLMVLRFVQGLFTGTVPATMALVAATAPKERSGMAMGSLQTAIYLGVSLGPFFGGLSGDALGYRPSFWVTGALLFISGILVLFFVHEEFQPAPRAARGGDGYGRGMLLVLGSGALLAAFAARILLRIGNGAINPILPLYVQTLLPAGAQVGIVTGLISGVSSLGSAVGAPLIGNWSDRLGHRRLLIICAMAAGIFFVPQAFVHDPRWLIAWQFCSGFAVGGTLATLTALLARLTPEGRAGVVFGLDSSAMAVSNATGPLAGASVAAVWGLRAPFLLTSLISWAAASVIAVGVHVNEEGAAVTSPMKRAAHALAVSLKGWHSRR
ncbi:MAG: MFS transporter [Anaerolineae bacterium]